MLFTKKSLVIVAVLSFYILIGCKETKAPEKQLTTLSQPTDKNSIPILLTFSFQPSLQENTEVIINFEKKYLLFRNIYPYVPEPLPPPRVDGKTSNELTDKRLIVTPYSSSLRDSELNQIAKIVAKLSGKDFERVDGMYIDGISCNFSVLDSNGSFKNGFIANDMTDNQKMLYRAILNLLYTTNQSEQNRMLLNYFRYFSGH